MNNFIKGALALWTVLTTIWTFITFETLLEELLRLLVKKDDRILQQDDQYHM